MRADTIERGSNHGAIFEIQWLPELFQQDMSERLLQAHSHITTMAFDVFFQLAVILLWSLFQVRQEVDVFARCLRCVPAKPQLLLVLKPLLSQLQEQLFVLPREVGDLLSKLMYFTLDAH